MHAFKGVFSGLCLVALSTSVPLIAYYGRFLGFLGQNPTLFALLIGIVYGNFIKSFRAPEILKGVRFVSAELLYVAIVLYGFSLNIQDIFQLGLPAFVLASSMVWGTLFLGVFVIRRFCAVDEELAILCSAGTAICGAAAVVGLGAVLGSSAHKKALAVSTTIFFGTVGMFLYPLGHALGVLNLEGVDLGLYIGSTLHAVSHVLAAGSMFTDEVLEAALLVKMIRVLWLIPVLVGLSIWQHKLQEQSSKKAIKIPWFTVGFLGAVVLNSCLPIPEGVSLSVKFIEKTLMTMAMLALGMETQFEQLKSVGAKSITLAGLLFLSMLGWGYCYVSYLGILDKTFS